MRLRLPTTPLKGGVSLKQEFMDTKLIKSKINLLKARIEQINESELYSEKEREHLLEVANKELEGYTEQLKSLEL